MGHILELVDTEIHSYDHIPKADWIFSCHHIPNPFHWLDTTTTICWMFLIHNNEGERWKIEINQEITAQLLDLQRCIFDFWYFQFAIGFVGCNRFLIMLDTIFIWLLIIQVKQMPYLCLEPGVTSLQLLVVLHVPGKVCRFTLSLVPHLN